ncbi:MAG: carboxypeptidase regulatory-like domain-containing protein [Gemmatimonadota bacterium]|nr:carboxypeptidase regulatory-like domain-containing protein [Gemmatimonadota bacterium]
MRRGCLVIALTTTASLFGGSIAYAQAPPPRLFAVDGAVTDSALRPVGDAVVSIVGTSIAVITGANGRFLITGLPSGRHTLNVRKIGFEPVVAAVESERSDTLHVAFSLQSFVPILGGVRVVGERKSLAMREFDDRRAKGGGQFITQAEIEKRNVVFTSHLFRPLLGVVVKGTLLNRRAGLTECPMTFYVDGVKIPSPLIDVHLPSPPSIAGIEVYTSTATAPLQYRSTENGFCGVVLVWTRVG